MIDVSHLDALQANLNSERIRLANAKSKGEIEIRTVWVAQLEKEVAHEMKFLGLEDIQEIKLDATEQMSDEDLLSELLS